MPKFFYQKKIFSPKIATFPFSIFIFKMSNYMAKGNANIDRTRRTQHWTSTLKSDAFRAWLRFVHWFGKMLDWLVKRKICITIPNGQTSTSPRFSGMNSHFSYVLTWKHAAQWGRSDIHSFVFIVFEMALSWAFGNRECLLEMMQRCSSRCASVNKMLFHKPMSPLWWQM